MLIVFLLWEDMFLLDLRLFILRDRLISIIPAVSKKYESLFQPHHLYHSFLSVSISVYISHDLTNCKCKLEMEIILVIKQIILLLTSVIIIIY
jgi:hypothetical protein